MFKNSDQLDEGQNAATHSPQKTSGASPNKTKTRKKLTIIGEEQQEEELKCDDDECSEADQQGDSPEGFGGLYNYYQNNTTPTAEHMNLLQQDNENNEQDQLPTEGTAVSKSQIKKQKRLKSKQIKKILKERLNIDCLRMLGEETTGPEEHADDCSPGGQHLKPPMVLNNSQTNPNDSYNVLMREIGIDNNEGLSHAFVLKNGEAQREELNSFTEMFSVRDLLGVGAFGVVLMVKNRKTKEKSALKIIAKERLSARAQKVLKNESTIMQTMDHESVVSLKRIFENQKFIILEMELIPGGQLKRLFKLKDKAGKPKPLTDFEASQIMLSLLKGVAYVHARDIIHRDLKPENILLVDPSDECQEVKIVDFGLSAEQNWRLRHNERAGTPIYMAPEQITGKGYSKKVDVWACGIIAYQLLACGQHPCYNPGDVNYYKKLQNIETKPIEWKFPANFTPLAKDFFLNLCAYPPSQRYDAATALQHPWLTRNDNDEIPLNQQQELTMFQREHQLRKVMRLVYFASHVKMYQVGFKLDENSKRAASANQDKDSCTKVTSNALTTMQHESSPQMLHNNKNGEDQKSVQNDNNISTTQQSQPNSNSGNGGMKSKSPTKPRRSLQLQPEASKLKALNESQMAATQQPKYRHDSFLQQSSFTNYKELILREVVSAANQKCHNQLEESTSAESPSRHGERDIKTGDHSLENNPADSPEQTSMPSKPLSFKDANSKGASNSNSGSPAKRLKGRKNLNNNATANTANNALNKLKDHSGNNQKLISPIQLNQQKIIGAQPLDQEHLHNHHFDQQFGQSANNGFLNDNNMPETPKLGGQAAGVAYATTTGGFLVAMENRHQQPLAVAAAPPPPLYSENNRGNQGGANSTTYQQLQRRLTKQGSNLSSTEPQQQLYHHQAANSVGGNYFSAQNGTKSGSNKHPGRNIVHVRSPIHQHNKAAADNDYDYFQQQRDHSAGNGHGHGNSGLSQEMIGAGIQSGASNGSAGFASRKAKFIQKNGGIKVSNGGNTGNSLEAIGSPAYEVMSGQPRKSKLVLYQAQDAALAKAEAQQQSRKKGANSNYPIVKDILKHGKDSSNKLACNNLLSNTTEMGNSIQSQNNQQSQQIQQQLQQQNLQFTMEPSGGAVTAAMAAQIVEDNVIGNTTNNSPSINFKKAECMTPEATTTCLSKESSIDRNIGPNQQQIQANCQGPSVATTANVNQDNTNERQSSTKNLQLVKQKSMSTKKSGGNNHRVNLVDQANGGGTSAIVSKSSKKRSTKKSKTVNMTGQADFSSCSNAGGLGRVLQQQATFEVQSTKLTFMKGHQKESLKMAPGIDTKIDWLQMAKDEKTMAGSKLLQEQLSKAQPTYELNGEQLRSSRTHILQEGGQFKKQSQPTMIYQAPIAENMGSRTQYKSFKGSRHKTKSPLVQHNQKLANQSGFAQSHYQVDGKINYGSFNIGGSPSQKELMSVFASPETQKRPSNPYTFATSANNTSSTKKKNKSSAKKAAKLAAAAIAAEQQCQSGNPFSPTLPCGTNSGGTLRNCISTTSAEETATGCSIINRVSSNNLQMGGSVIQQPSQGLPWPQNNNSYYTTAAASVTQNTSGASGVVGVCQNFSSVYKRNNEKHQDQEQHLVALLTPAPKRSKPLQKITTLTNGGSASQQVQNGVNGNSHSIVASTGSVGSQKAVAPLNIGTHHKKNSNSFDNNAWGQAAIDTQLRLDRANRAAIEAAGGASGVLNPMQRIQNSKDMGATDFRQNINENNSGSSVMIKRRSATQANRIAAALDSQNAAMAIQEQTFRLMQQATPQPLDQQQAYMTAPITQIAPFQARQKRPKSKNRVIQVMTSQEFYNEATSQNNNFNGGGTSATNAVTATAASDNNDQILQRHNTQQTTSNQQDDQNMD